MAISFVNAASAHTTGTATSLTISKPTGVAAGDILIAFIGSENGSSGPFTRDQTWNTAIAEWNASATDGTGITLWRLATSSEPATYQFTSSGSADFLEGGIAAFRGVDNTTPIDAVGGTPTGINGVGHSVTVVTAGAYVLFLCNTDAAVTPTAPTGMTQMWSIAGAGNIEGGCAAYEGPDSAGATGDRTSNGSTTTRAMLLALRPAAAVLGMARGMFRRRKIQPLRYKKPAPLINRPIALLAAPVSLIPRKRARTAVNRPRPRRWRRIYYPIGLPFVRIARVGKRFRIFPRIKAIKPRVAKRFSYPIGMPFLRIARLGKGVRIKPRVPARYRAWRHIRNLITPPAGIAPVGTPTATTQGFVNTLVINYPSGTASGDVALCWLTGSSGHTVTGSKTWTTIATTVNNGGFASYLLERILDGTEGASETFTITATFTLHCATMRVYRGVNNVTPQDTAGGNLPVATATTGSATFASVTTVQDGDELVAFCNTVNAITSASAPSGFGNAFSAFDATNACSVNGWDRAQGTHAATGALSSTLSAAAGWFTVLVALQPVSAAVFGIARGTFRRRLKTVPAIVRRRPFRSIRVPLFATLARARRLKVRRSLFLRRTRPARRIYYPIGMPFVRVARASAHYVRRRLPRAVIPRPARKVRQFIAAAVFAVAVRARGRLRLRKAAVARRRQLRRLRLQIFATLASGARYARRLPTITHKPRIRPPVRYLLLSPLVPPKIVRARQRRLPAKVRKLIRRQSVRGVVFSSPPSFQIPPGLPSVLLVASASAAAPFTATLPIASGSGDWVIVIKADANAQPVVVAPSETDTINGVNAPDDLTTQWQVGRYVDYACGAWVKW